MVTLYFLFIHLFDGIRVIAKVVEEELRAVREGRIARMESILAVDVVDVVRLVNHRPPVRELNETASSNVLCCRRITGIPILDPAPPFETF